MRYFYISLAFVPFFVISCNKDITSNVIDSSYAEADGQSDDAFSEVDGITESSMSYNNLGGRMEASSDTMILCAQIGINRDTKTITIDFGDGCQGFGGRVRKGKIIITYTTPFFMPGSVTTTTFQDFYLNNVKVEGTCTLTNISDSVNQAPVFHAVLTDGKLTWPDSTTALRTSDFTKTWIRKQNPYNDEYSLTGSASGTTRKGKTYDMEITSPLIFKRACWLLRDFIAVQGIKTITSGGITMSIYYGDGTCDRMVTITVNGETRTIEVTKGK